MQLSEESLLKEAKNFHLKKKLGQHFLINPEALQCITSSLSATADSTIVEIGPGIGFLTRVLAETGARVIAVELDRESVADLEKMQLKNVEIKHGDFLRFDLSRLDFLNAAQPAGTGDGAKQLRVAGNVPYQITGLILGHLLGEIDRPAPWLSSVAKIVLTVQKEVAQRMVALPGTPDYSRVSILTSYFCQAELEMALAPSDFFPPPRVSSAIVSLRPRSEPLVQVKNAKLMKQIINAGFRQRRKMLRNALSFLLLPAAELDCVFKELSFDPQVRAERLSLPQFAMLADALNGHLNTNAQDSSAGPF